MGDSAGSVEVRRVGVDEGPGLRALRLRALRDAPLAFAVSLEVEIARPDSFWTELADASARGTESVAFAAVDRGRWVGMGGSYWFDHALGIAQLWGMWVEPGIRGRGTGRVLVEEIAGWAARAGAAKLRLGVIDRAAEVAAFYERLGFRPTGETKLLPPNGAATAFFLAKSL